MVKVEAEVQGHGDEEGQKADAERLRATPVDGGRIDTNPVEEEEEHVAEGGDSFHNPDIV